MFVFARRKPLSCINRCPNQINEHLSTKLCFDDDFADTGNVSEHDDMEDNEITINPTCVSHKILS